MPKTLLAIGAHYDDCVFGIPGILLQAVRKHHRVVILSVIGDYSNWPPVKGRDKELVRATTDLCKEFGAEIRFLEFASGRFEPDAHAKRAVSAVVADVKPDIAFALWPHDHHPDHVAAAALSRSALRLGGRVLDDDAFKSPGAIYAYDNGPGHTIGFEPDTYVDVSDVWEPAADWLGKLMALMRGKPYDRTVPDGAVQAKTALARYRGLACGARYAEALRASNVRPRDIL